MKKTRIWRVLLFAYLIILLCISLSAYFDLLPEILNKIPNYDIIMHFILLGFAGYLSHRALNRRFWLNGWIPAGPVIVSLLSVVEECSQMLSPVRSFSLQDMLANLSGIAIFYLADIIISGQYKSDSKEAN
ncbi:MAG: VanZ family protein [Bacteroidota bacterium]